MMRGGHAFVVGESSITEVEETVATGTKNKRLRKEVEITSIIPSFHDVSAVQSKFFSRTRCFSFEKHESVKDTRAGIG